MTVRFALDENSWAEFTASSGDLDAAVAALLDRLDTARERNEAVVKHPDFYETAVGVGALLYEILFSDTSPVRLERDICERLRLALDRIAQLDEGEMISYDATFGGCRRFAPGVAWAHGRREQGHAVAVLPLPRLGGTEGPTRVVVGSTAHTLYFVTTEDEHTAFFRDAISVEDMGHDLLQAIAHSAFPELVWVDGVWHELRAHRKCFFGPHRDTLVRHLAVLNDHGARLFHEHPGGSGVDKELDALGVDASPENGKARNHEPSKRDRTRTFQGRSHVFWWHTKMRWDEGRVHFLHQPSQEAPQPSEFGRIVIGIFVDHCVLP